jgi:hypothetical protein
MSYAAPECHMMLRSCLLLAFAAWHADAAAVRKAEILTADPVCWKRVDVRLDIASTHKSAFDPDEIRVDAVFRAPSGRTFNVPAFVYQPFEREVRGKADAGESQEILHTAGQPEWRVRFLPQEPGRYTVEVTARDMSDLMVKWLDKLTVFKKPYLWAEFGVARIPVPPIKRDIAVEIVHMEPK